MLPVLGSRSALLRFSTISLMDEIDPFLQLNRQSQSQDSQLQGYNAAERNAASKQANPSPISWWGSRNEATHILKLPPTKNLRAMMSDLEE